MNEVRLAPDVRDSPTGNRLCGGPIWNTRAVFLPDLAPEDDPLEGLSRFIFSPETGVQYKVRFGAEPACDGLVAPLEGDEKSGVTITGGADVDGDEKSDSWTLNATGRVASVTRAIKSSGPRENSGFKCVGIYGMSWVATLTKK